PFVLLSAIPANTQTVTEPVQTATYSSLREALMSGGLRAGNGPRSVNWIDEGDRFSFITSNSENRRSEIRAQNPETGEDELIFDGSGITFPGSDRPFAYRSFQWAGDSRHLLFETNFRPVYRHSGVADYYFYSLDNKTLQLVARDAGTAELSPDGSMIGFERNGDMYIYSFDTGRETRLTSDATEHVFNGRFGWVYEEEFGLAQAWSWSHDSNYIAFWQEDESKVPVFQMTDFSGSHAEYVKIRYPKVGDVNPTVRIGVVNVRTGASQWLNTGESPDSYIPRIYWTSDPQKIAVVHLNRDQNHIKLFSFDLWNGQRRLIMEEKSEQWIDVFNFFEGINHHFFFPDGVRELFWISDRNGNRHLYRYHYDGRLLNQVTTGEWDVSYVHAVDPSGEIIYYSSTETSPLERHLYSIRFDGTGKQQISTETGRHYFDVSPNTLFYIDRWSNTETPTRVALRRMNGEIIRMLEENSAVSEFTNNHFYAPRELFSFITADSTVLDGYIVKPSGFDETKQYPLMLNIYGGPGAQSVYNQFESNGWVQYLAQEGWVVASVNNRGSGGYGREFEKIVYRNLGHPEAGDFTETANYLAGKPWIDGDRMAIRGHSYGGYMAALTMVLHPGVFSSGIATAPATDWRLYDTIYTERYMGQLSDNEDGYINSSVTHHADKLEGRLLLVHSGMDENVHMQHTMQLLRALTDAGKDADLRIFPPGAHGVSYNTQSFLLLHEIYTNHLNNYTKQNQ
ncbi:MAG: S9 family peptidase, partial [Rhodothermaceae bacterium]|nr:S9 family peptidase [Rhodothermaceae bacterium]